METKTYIFRYCKNDGIFERVILLTTDTKTHSDLKEKVKHYEWCVGVFPPADIKLLRFVCMEVYETKSVEMVLELLNDEELE